MERVSVVMAVYNGRPFLEQQIRSLLADLGRDDEVVIVDDASSDDSANWIESLGDDRVRILRNSTNRGVVKTFEAGLSHASGDVIFLCDQDDVWLPGKRDCIMEQFRRNPDVVVVVSDAEVIDEFGTVVRESFMVPRGGFGGNLTATLWRNRYLGCAMAFRRGLLRVALPIPAKVPMHDMWLGAMASSIGITAYVDRSLIQYRRHSGNYSRPRRARPTTMIIWRWRLLWAVVSRRLGLFLGGVVNVMRALRNPTESAVRTLYSSKRLSN